MITKKKFIKNILTWYQEYGRKKLPWQLEKNIYKIWISEIMLQQTQVSTVIPYFERFMVRFPNIDTLAHASLDELLHLWTGLGYYKRAHNLHKAAKIIKKKYNSKFPINYQEVISLPGIGRSTAGAILSLSCELPYPILEGNIKRLLTRYYAIDGWPGNKDVEKILWNIVENLIPKKNIAQFNQAMMDIGALVCIRQNPHCIICPLQHTCFSYNNSTWQNYPTKKPKKLLPKRIIYFLIIENNKKVWLEKNIQKNVWHGLFTFPQFINEDDLKQWLKIHNINEAPQRFSEFRHILSHLYLDIIPMLLKLNLSEALINPDGIWYNLLDPPIIGIPAPVKRLLDQLN